NNFPVYIRPQQIQSICGAKIPYNEYTSETTLHDVANWSEPAPPRRRSRKTRERRLRSMSKTETIRLYLIESVRLIPQARMVAKLQPPKKLMRMGAKTGSCCLSGGALEYSALRCDPRAAGDRGGNSILVLPFALRPSYR